MGSIIDGNKKELEKEIYAHALSGEFKVHIGFRAVGTRKSNVILMMILAAISSIFYFSSRTQLEHQIYFHSYHNAPFCAVCLS
jgi:hypothetical protein